METVTHDQDQLSVLTCQMAVVQDRYPGLALVRVGLGRLAVQGKIRFSMEHGGRPIEEEFDIELRVPPDYPRSPPHAYETQGKLDGFDHILSDGQLCLGAPVEVCARFAKKPNLLSFIEELVVPFLFAFSYKNQYGEMPFGELAHGMKGILEYYTHFFETSREGAILLLKCLADDIAPPLDPCPCGSGRKLKNCHGPRLNALRPHQTAQAFEDELRKMVSTCREGGSSHGKLLPRRFRRRLARQLGKSKGHAAMGRR